MKRDTTKTIWRTVVFAGAMLGAPACTKKQAQTTPTNNATSTDAVPASTDDATPAPRPIRGGRSVRRPIRVQACDRPRGTDDDGGGGTGRGFVLS